MFRWSEWAALAAAGLFISLAAPVSDYRVFSVECVRSAPLFFVLLWMTAKCIAYARSLQWRSAFGCLSIAVAAALLFFTGQAIGDYFEVHWAARAMAPEINANDRHIAARMIYGNALGDATYVVFDPADGDVPSIKHTFAQRQNVCVNGLRAIGDRFYLVRTVGQPC